MLAEFRREYDGIDVDVAFSDWTSSSFSEGCDVAFQPFSTVSDTTDLMIRRLRALRLGLYASPSYVQRRGRPARASDLQAWEMLVPRFIERRVLTLYRGNRTVELEPHVAFIGDDLSFVLAMVRAGAGFAIVPESEAEADVRAGSLVRLFVEFAAKTLGEER